MTRRDVMLQTAVRMSATMDTMPLIFHTSYSKMAAILVFFCLISSSRTRQQGLICKETKELENGGHFGIRCLGIFLPKQLSIFSFALRLPFLA